MKSWTKKTNKNGFSSCVLDEFECGIYYLNAMFYVKQVPYKNMRHFDTWVSKHKSRE
jgi:hypothetical protein